MYFHPELYTFLAKILYWWQESHTIPSVFSSTPQRLSVGVEVSQFMCENVSSCSLTHVSSCFTFTTRTRWIVLEYARAIREEKIHRWDNLLIQHIQETLAEPRPDQLKQSQIMTQQFSDLNRNYNFFCLGSVFIQEVLFQNNLRSLQTSTNGYDSAVGMFTSKIDSNYFPIPKPRRQQLSQLHVMCIYLFVGSFCFTYFNKNVSVSELASC